jgi:single stranded DNA-binding protein
MLNKAILTGRLTTKPELKTTTSGVSVTQFSLAVQRNFKDSSGNYAADFISIVAWRNQAEFASKYFDKGSLMTVVGSIQTRSYEDKNGNKRTATEVVAEEVLDGLTRCKVAKKYAALIQQEFYAGTTLIIELDRQRGAAFGEAMGGLLGL